MSKIGGPVPTPYKEVYEETPIEDIPEEVVEPEPVEKEPVEEETEPTFDTTEKKEELVEIPTVTEVKVADDDKIKSFVEGFTEMKSKLDSQDTELTTLKDAHAKEIESLNKTHAEELKKIKSALRKAIYG